MGSHESSPVDKAESFEWRINSPRGFFSGEQKAALVERMEEIAERISQGQAEVEFSYDVGSVIAKIRAKIDEPMRERSQAKARRTATRGVTGLVAWSVMRWNGMGKDAQAKLIAGLEADYLRDEKAWATAEMAKAFKMIISHSAATAEKVVESAPAPPSP